ncbi:MAG: DUF4476 domain-containing protein [Bacteroidetes bacterium]|nr:DUF4476 domain-containing protein [Bacteroidota bacterium]MBU1720260.1 DUF4476 domain-containing protein [Bacteroidota bacterium]
MKSQITGGHAMKKLLLSFALMLFAASFSFASDISLKMYDNSTFSVKLDGKLVNGYATACSIINIAGGVHHFEIYKQYFSFGSTSVVKVFDGMVTISDLMDIKAMITMNNKFKIISQTSQVAYTPPVYNPAPSYNGGYGASYGGQQGHGGYGNHGGGHGGNAGNGYGSGYGYSNYAPAYSGMSPYTFGTLKSMMEDATFDSSQLKIAKQAISASGVSSAQVLELMNILAFESSKLDLAKFAYPFCVDKQNYFVVNSGFTFSSSIDGLCRFLYGDDF